MEALDFKFIDEMKEIFKNRKYPEAELGYLLCKIVISKTKDRGVIFNDENYEKLTDNLSAEVKSVIKALFCILYHTEKP